jgi:DNA-binding transcriptional regulator GbsR (MarR family)
MTPTAKPLAASVTRFIVNWGEMGARWGINRTVAQVHALLFVSKEPLTAEDIAQSLSVARSNVSTSIHELQAWRLIKVVHVLGDRRDHFQVMGDSWETLRIILEERKRREIDPTIRRLRDCIDDVDSAPAAERDAYAEERLRELLGIFDTMNAWYDQLQRLPRTTVMKLVKLGAKIGKVLDGIR